MINSDAIFEPSFSKGTLSCSSFLIINSSNLKISSNVNPSSFALSSCSKCPFIGINTLGVPYAFASSIVDFPASEIKTSDAKITS